jgi:hypothetical protein
MQVIQEREIRKRVLFIALPCRFGRLVTEISTSSRAVYGVWTLTKYVASAGEGLGYPDRAVPTPADFRLLEGNGLTLAAACVAHQPIDLGAPHTGHAGLLLTPSCHRWSA